MNGVMNASVSPGSSQRAARVTWTPQVSVPSGAAAAGPGRAGSTSRASSVTIAERARDGLMAPPMVRYRTPDPGAGDRPALLPTRAGRRTGTYVPAIKRGSLAGDGRGAAPDYLSRRQLVMPVERRLFRISVPADIITPRREGGCFPRP